MIELNAEELKYADGAVFATAIRNALDHGVSAADITAPYTRRPQDAVRWASGNNLPHVAIRPHVITHINKLIAAVA